MQVKVQLPTPEQWRMMFYVVKLLEPFMCVQRTLEGERHVTNSLCIPLICDVRSSLRGSVDLVRQRTQAMRDDTSAITALANDVGSAAATAAGDAGGAAEGGAVAASAAAATVLTRMLRYSGAPRDWQSVSLAVATAAAQAAATNVAGGAAAAAAATEAVCAAQARLVRPESAIMTAAEAMLVTFEEKWGDGTNICHYGEGPRRQPKGFTKMQVRSVTLYSHCRHRCAHCPICTFTHARTPRARARAM